MPIPPEVKYVNFTKSGVDLVPDLPTSQTSPIRAYLGPDVYSALAPILPYSVAIRNNNAIPVSELVVRWTLTSSVGVKAINPGHFKFGGTNLRTGEMILMAPLSGLSLPMRGYRPNLINTADLSSRMAKLTQKYQSQSDISVALDSIVFQDDTLIGPDLEGKLGSINSERRLKRLVADELLKRSPTERNAYIQSLLATPEAIDLCRVAEMYKGITDTLNSASLGEDSFRASVENVVNRSHDIHRRDQ